MTERGIIRTLEILAAVLVLSIIVLASPQRPPWPHQADELHLRSNDFAMVYNEWAVKITETGIHDIALAKKVNRKFKRLQNSGAWPRED